MFCTAYENLPVYPAFCLYLHGSYLMRLEHRGLELFLMTNIGSFLTVAFNSAKAASLNFLNFPKLKKCISQEGYFEIYSRKHLPLRFNSHSCKFLRKLYGKNSIHLFFF